MTWLLILALGAVMVTSAGVATHPELLPRHGVYLALALVVFIAVLLVPLRWWQATHRLAWVLAAALCALVLVPGVGSEVNGALRWIAIGPAKVQPAELAKFLLLIYLAGYLTRFAERIADEPWVMVKPLGMVGIIAALLLAQPDFGTAVVLASTACGLLFITGARLRHFLMIVILAGGGLLLIAYQQPYRLSRLITFTDPWAYATDGGYQLTQALIAFGRGQTFGLGLGEGIQKLDYLPEAHNDFIYAVIAEELGLIGAIGVILLFGFLVLRMLRLARLALARDRLFAGYLVYGVALLLGLQYLVNLGVNTGVLPTKGLTLPFVSYGGNSLVVSCALLALVCRSLLEADDG
jgi:cell division protein FtsW